MQQAVWTDRKFSFDFPLTWLPNVVERLRGTPARLNELVTGVTDVRAAEKRQGKWSIKEHIGHLADLEELHLSRLDDFINRRKVLSPADMTNAATNQANHNARSLRQLIIDFSNKRKSYITRLILLDEETLHTRAMHPRLRKQMRPVDTAFFAAEHDDHHLASIRRLVQLNER